VALHVRVQMIRERRVRSVHLRLERIQDAHSMSGLDQRVRQMRTDETRAARDENA
jgi:hypothetical protein